MSSVRFQMEEKRLSRRGFLKAGVCAAGALAAAPALAAVAKRPLPAFDLGFVDEKLVLYRRSEWTDSDARAWLLREAGTFDRVTVHHVGRTENTHTEKNAIAVDIESVYAAHRERSYGDIGYHFVVDYAGSVWEGRSLSYEGAHVADENERNVGIVLLGNFELQQPSREQRVSLQTLVTLLRQRFEIKGDRVYGHRDLGSSVCPGAQLYPYVRTLREAAATTTTSEESKQENAKSKALD